MLLKLLISFSLVLNLALADSVEDWFSGLSRLEQTQLLEFSRPNSGEMKLRYIYLKNENSYGKRAVVISPGFAENHFKYSGLIEKFYSEGFDIFIINHRAMGASDRYPLVWDMTKELNQQIVHIDSFQDYVDDFKYFIETVIKKNHQYKGELFLFSHSTGGLIAAHAMSQSKKLFKSAILSAPLMGIKYSLTEKFIVNLGQGLNLNKRFGPVGTNKLWDANTATHDLSSTDTSDEKRWGLYIDVLKNFPHFVQSPASRGWIEEVEKFSSNAQLKKLASSIRVPLHLFTAGKDNYVNTKRHFLFKKYVLKHNEESVKNRKRNEQTRLSHYYLGYEDSYHCIFRDKLSEKQLKTILRVFNLK